MAFRCADLGKYIDLLAVDAIGSIIISALKGHNPQDMSKAGNRAFDRFIVKVTSNVNSAQKEQLIRIVDGPIID